MIDSCKGVNPPVMVGLGVPREICGSEGGGLWCRYLGLRGISISEKKKPMAKFQHSHYSQGYDFAIRVIVNHNVSSSIPCRYESTQ